MRALQWRDQSFDCFILELQQRASDAARALVEERRPVIEQVAKELCENE